MVQEESTVLLSQREFDLLNLMHSIQFGEIEDPFVPHEKPSKSMKLKKSESELIGRIRDGIQQWVSITVHHGLPQYGVFRGSEKGYKYKQKVKFSG